jgi:hypothetical protein
MLEGELREKLEKIHDRLIATARSPGRVLIQRPIQFPDRENLLAARPPSRSANSGLSKRQGVPLASGVCEVSAFSRAKLSNCGNFLFVKTNVCSLRLNFLDAL